MFYKIAFSLLYILNAMREGGEFHYDPVMLRNLSKFIEAEKCDIVFLPYTQLYKDFYKLPTIRLPTIPCV